MPSWSKKLWQDMEPYKGNLNWLVRPLDYRVPEDRWWLVLTHIPSDARVYHKGYKQFMVRFIGRAPVKGFDTLDAAVAYVEMAS